VLIGVMKELNLAALLNQLELHVLLKFLPQHLIAGIELLHQILDVYAGEAAELFLDIAADTQVFLDSRKLNLHVIDVCESLLPYGVFIPTQVAVP
jgi:hypothetical protein